MRVQLSSRPSSRGASGHTAALLDLGQRAHPLCGLALALLGIALSLPVTARADAASGTVSGTLSARGNYYWERSTRVVAPALVAHVDAPQGSQLDASYLLDSVTSASVAAGAQTDAAFTEIRHDVRAGLGHSFSLKGRSLLLSAQGRYSREPDYRSRGGGASAALRLAQNNATLRLSGYYLHDAVFARRQRAGTLRALSLGIAWDQVLSPSWTATFGYDASWLSGFTENPYRLAIFADGGAAPEDHPEQRLRSALYAWLAHYFVATRSALRLGYRVYRDSWEIMAHSADLRLYQELNDHAEVRLRYRYYGQTAARFFREGGNVRADRYVTADPKMSPFEDHTFGIKLRLSLDFLAHSALRSLSGAILDWAFEYIVNNNRYGNGVIAQGGLSLPF